MKKPHLIVVDDHPLFARSVASGLSDNITADVTTCTTTTQATHDILAHAPDLVLLDYNLGDDCGLDLFTKLSPFAPSTRWLACTASTEPSILRQIILAGVHGIILKSAELDELHTAVSTILDGQPYVSPAVSEIIHGIVYNGPALSIGLAVRKISTTRRGDSPPGADRGNFIQGSAKGFGALRRARSGRG